MSKLISSVARLFRMGHRDAPMEGTGRAQAPVTLRDPAWLVRSSGWAPVMAARGPG